jgi:Icc-related predicted phosphoesterase
MLVLHASDLHGHTSHYRELDRLCRERGPEVLVLGGDLLPHERGTPSSQVPLQARYLLDEVIPLLTSLKHECGVLSLVMLGNDDFAVHQSSLERECQRSGLVALHGIAVRLENILFAGCSFVSFTPFLLKDWELPDYTGERLRPGCLDDGAAHTFRTVPKPQLASIAQVLENLTAERGDEEVLVAHAPPYGGALDRLWDGTAAGSKAVRDFLLKQQPILSLHGHIHESPAVSGRWAEAVGRTLAVQPGQTPERLHAVLVETADPFGTAWHTVYGALGHERNGRSRLMGY